MNTKTLGAMAVVALMLAANVASAGNVSEDGNSGKYHREFERGGETNPERGLGIFHRWFRDGDKPKHGGMRPDFSDDMFVAFGEVKSVSSDELVIHTNDDGDGRKGSRNVSVDEDVTIQLDSDTKFHLKGEEADSGDIEQGMKVMVAGDKDGEALTANRVHVISDKSVVYGEVTAVTDDSVTIRDAKTDETQTISLDSDTKVLVNGDESSVDDIEVGDKGFVKIRSILGDVWSKVVRIFRK